MSEAPLTGIALQQRILIAKGTAYLASGILIGVSIVLSAPVAFTIIKDPGLRFLLFALGMTIWILVLLVAAKRFGDAEDLVSKAEAETQAATEVAS